MMDDTIVRNDQVTILEIKYELLNIINRSFVKSLDPKDILSFHCFPTIIQLNIILEDLSAIQNIRKKSGHFCDNDDLLKLRCILEKISSDYDNISHDIERAKSTLRKCHNKRSFLIDHSQLITAKQIILSVYETKQQLLEAASLIVE
jgi:hypothetical protein